MRQWLKQEAAFIWWSGVILLFSSICIAVNLTITHYHGLNYHLHTMLIYLPWAIGMTIGSIYLRSISHRWSLVIDAVGKFYWVLLMFSVGVYAIQFTPFPFVDTSLLHFDQWLGFSTIAVYQFAQQHPGLRSAAKFAYQSLAYQLFFTPFLLSFLLEKKSVRIFFLANLISGAIAFIIYYFFPTTTPAHVVPGIDFTVEEYKVVAQWYEIHDHLKNYIHIGDIIGFPSYHVIWAILVTYACKNRWWLFYPLLLFNLLLVASTLLLGWHFLADVIGGAIIAVIVIYIAELSSRKMI